MFQIQKLIPFSLLVTLCLSFASKIQINTTAATTILTYQTDLGVCQCDLSGNCDNFCCCDPDCSTSLKTTWTNSGWCRVSSAQLQKLCSQLQGAGYSSFQDLACVFYTNRGQIGMYYNIPTDSEIVLPEDTKFANRITNSQAISEVQSQSYTYGSPLTIIRDGTQSTFNIWKPNVGTVCGIGFVQLTQTSQFSCFYPIQTTSDCTTVNSYLTATALDLCQQANCSATLSLGSISAGSCSSVLTSLTIDLTVSYQSNQYKITSSTITPVYSSISTPVNQQIKTSISITTGTQKSGNPGYIIGNQVVLKSGSIDQISDSLGDCLPSSDNTTLPISFGINTTYSCKFSAQTQYYIDTIAKGQFVFEKYANSSETAGVSVTGSNQSKNKEKVILNILYSYAGSSSHYQNYIVGSKVTVEDGQNTDTTKYLIINWIYIDPQTVVTPPSNLFYEYFTYLWLPLKSTYQTYLFAWTSTVPLLLIYIYAFI